MIGWKNMFQLGLAAVMWLFAYQLTKEFIEYMEFYHFKGLEHYFASVIVLGAMLLVF